DSRVDTSVTMLLHRLREGDRSASSELISKVYNELHRIAASRLNRERPGNTLQPTALVNEAYVRIFGKTPPEMADKAHFLAIASQIMRRILVDHARTKSAKKRGGPMQRVELDVTMALQDSERDPVDILALNTALDALAAENPHLAEVIELSHFGGLTA